MLYQLPRFLRARLMLGDLALFGAFWWLTQWTWQFDGAAAGLGAGVMLVMAINQLVR